MDSRSLTTATFGGNVCWFGAAAYYFTVGAEEFVKRHANGEARTSAELRAATVYACRFLGGMNSALALLSLLRLRRRLGKSDKTVSNDASDRDVLVSSAVAHFSQWVFNLLPYVAYVQDRTSDQPLRFTKQMRLIFVLDGFMTVCNAVAAAK